MKIISLKAPAFKGRNIDQQFIALNVIVGENCAGKSAITQALEVGNYGSLLALGKTNELTFQLCSDPSDLYVRVAFDDGSENLLSLNRSPDGRITRTQNTGKAFPRVMIDAQEYFEKTEQQRLQYVLERVNVKRCGYDELDLRDKMFKPIQASTLRKLWENNWKTSIRQRDETHSPIMVWMESLLSRLKGAKKECDVRVKSIKASIKQLEIDTATKQKNNAAERAAAHEALIKAQSKIVAKKDDGLRDLERERDDLTRCKNDALNDLHEIEVEQMDMRKLAQCPTCKAKGSGWLESWLEDSDNERSKLQKELNEAKKSIAVLDKKIEALKSVKPDKAQLQREQAVRDAQHVYDEIDEKQMSYLQWVRNCESLTVNNDSLLALIKESEALGGMIDALVEYQQQLMVKAFASLIKIASSFTIGLIKGDLAYHEGELGYWDGKLFVRHSTFSGTEKLLAYAGLQIALAQESPVKYVVLDECGRLHPSMKVRVVSRLLTLISDETINQAFMIDTTSDAYRDALKAGKLQLITV